ncbi:branched-chain amino acid ABC transporter permease [Ramlibacter sp. MAHUQ-53]|uniref:branched-chain amino acid ABC transporter permease n=1 Tax=unclassified Ramlibacter TaxID=2617605 RepID=UPI0036438331
MSPSAILVENILQALVTSLLMGGVYGLLCVGLGLIFSIMRVINFAQGEFMMLGMYAALFAFGSLGLGAMLGAWGGLVVSALLAGVALYLLGAALHPGLLARVTGARVSGTEGEGHYPQLILTLGISLVMANGGLLLFGSSQHTIQTPLSSDAWGLPLGAEMMVFFNKARSLSLVVALAMVLVVILFITRSRTGKTLRAAADNPVAASYMGIDVSRAHRTAFALGGAVTGIAGGLLASSYPFQPYVGHEFIVIMYTGVVLGGMGSVKGALWGGILIGFIQQMSSLFLPLQLQGTAIFLVFLLTLLLRPEGLFGRSTDRA